MQFNPQWENGADDVMGVFGYLFDENTLRPFVRDLAEARIYLGPYFESSSFFKIMKFVRICIVSLDIKISQKFNSKIIFSFFCF